MGEFHENKTGKLYFTLKQLRQSLGYNLILVTVKIIYINYKY